MHACNADAETSLQVAYMMDSNVKEGHFIQHLALLRGTARAGMAQLYARLQPSADLLSVPCNSVQGRRILSERCSGAAHCEIAETSLPEATIGQLAEVQAVDSSNSNQASARQTAEAAFGLLQQSLEKLTAHPAQDDASR